MPVARAVAMCCLFLALFQGMAQLCFAQLGDQFQVNQTTVQSQRWPEVTQAPNGDFIVSWQFNFTGIVVRKFARDGSPITGDISVAPGRGVKAEADVGSAQNGSFAVVWRFQDDYLTADGLRLRLLDENAVPRGPAFEVPSSTGGYRSQPAIGMANDGSFLVVWDGYKGSSKAPTQTNIRGQLFDPQGLPQGEEFEVNSTSTGYQYSAAVEATSTGFVVAWESNSQVYPDPPETEIRARRLDHAANPLGDDFRANSSTTGSHGQVSIATLQSGDFVISWRHFDSGTSGRAQRFGSDGTPAGPEFQINSDSTFVQYPRLAKVGDGFVATWATGGLYSEIGGRRFDAEGNPLGGDFQIDTFAYGYYQAYPAVAGSLSSDFVVVWESSGSPGDDNNYESIQGRANLGGPIFEDGFESGDASAWTLVVP